MRTTPGENRELGRRLAERLNPSQGPSAVYLPLTGVSVISAPGQPFHWPEADEALFQSIREALRPEIPVFELDVNINDPAFSEAVADGLLQLLVSQGNAGPAQKSSTAIQRRSLDHDEKIPAISREVILSRL